MMDNRRAIELYPTSFTGYMQRTLLRRATPEKPEKPPSTANSAEEVIHSSTVAERFLPSYRLLFRFLRMILSAADSITPPVVRIISVISVMSSGRINLEIPDTEGNKRWENKFTRPHNGFTASGLFWRGSIIAHWRLPTDGFNRFHFPLMLCTESRGILPS